MSFNINNLTVEADLITNTFKPLANTTNISLNGTLLLTSLSSFTQILKGDASGFSVNLPNATTLSVGSKFEIWNETNSPIIIKYFDTTSFVYCPPKSLTLLTLEQNSSSNGSWLYIRSFSGLGTGLYHYHISSSTTFSLSAGTSDTLITGFSLTPISGEYALWYDGSIQITGNNTQVRTTFYKQGVLWTESLRTIRSSVSTFYTTHSTLSTIPFDGTETLEVRVARNNNSLTITGRSLILIRLQDI